VSDRAEDLTLLAMALRDALVVLAQRRRAAGRGEEVTTMPKVTFYAVYIDDAVEHWVACPTLAEARRERAARGTPGLDGSIVRVVASGGLRDLVCRAYNREGYADDRVEVEPDLPEKKEE
jgi:hypothetical protein